MFLDQIDFPRPKLHRLYKLQVSRVRLHLSSLIKLFRPSVPAVRKNRYVILPVDFEEAWKVSYLFLFVNILYNLKN